MTKTYSAKFGDEELLRTWNFSERLAEGEEIIADSVALSARGPGDFDAVKVSVDGPVLTFRVSGGGLVGANGVINIYATTTADQTIGEQAFQPIKSR